MKRERLFLQRLRINIEVKKKKKKKRKRKMSLISFSESELKAGYLVQNSDWYDFEVTEYKEKPATTDGSPNHIWFLKGLSGEMDQVPVFKLISSKMKTDLLNIMKAFNGGIAPAPGQTMDPKDTVGLKVQAYTKRGQDQNGKTINDLVDFRPKA